MARGQVTQVAIIFILFIVAILGFWVSFTIIEALPATGTLTSAEAVTTISELDNLQSLFDMVVVLTVFLLSVGTVILSFAYRQHPVFLIAGVLALLAVQFVFPPFANTLLAASQTSALGSVANNWPLAIWLISNMALVGLIISGAVLIATYGKPSNNLSAF